MPRKLDGERGPWATEAVDLVRAASAGMLFGIPLLFTMEVWWTGTHTGPGQMIGVLLLTAVPVAVLNRTQGFRDEPDTTWAEAAKDTVETIAVGLLCVTAVLLLLHEIDADTPRRAAMGKIVYEAVPFGLGIGIAQHFLRGGRLDDGSGGSRKRRTGASATIADLGATAVGATFVALNIAPTDEVPMLAAAVGAAGLAPLVVASLVISYAIVFEGGFAKEDQRRQQPGLFQHPITETVVGYLVALGTALVMLWFFQRLGGPWTITLSHVIVLGLPAAVGGAAGRLAV